MERLTIKELAPYIPHDLEVIIQGTHTSSIRNLTKLGFDSNFLWNLEQGCVKILDLLPLSSINLKWFQDNIDEAIEDFRINCEPENNHFSVEVCERILGWSALALEEYQLFYRNHVDIHGLIDKGLALPIDGKEVKP